MKLDPYADKIMATELGALRMQCAISTEAYNACAELVHALCRNGLHTHARLHAAGVRFNLGAPWDSQGKARLSARLGGVA